MRGIPDWEPACTVIDNVSGDTLGTWERWEDAVLALSFEGRSLDDVELLAERSPIHAASETLRECPGEAKAPVKPLDQSEPQREREQREMDMSI